MQHLSSLLRCHPAAVFKQIIFTFSSSPEHVHYKVCVRVCWTCSLIRVEGSLKTSFTIIPACNLLVLTVFIEQESLQVLFSSNVSGNILRPLLHDCYIIMLSCCIILYALQLHRPPSSAREGVAPRGLPSGAGGSDKVAHLRNNFEISHD